MAWTIPTAKEISERLAGSLEAGLTRVRADLDPVAVSRAVRSVTGVFAQIGRAIALEVREVHDHQAWWARQYFVDTAEEEYILRHASIWGIDQRTATFARGTVLIEGVANTTLPQGIELTASDGAIYVTAKPAVISPAGSVAVEVRAVLSGSVGNLEPGIRLTPLAPYPSITRVTVDKPGLAGGTDEETADELQAATLRRIRQRPHGGAGFDYLAWLERMFAIKAIAVVPEWIGRGSVGIVVVMRDEDGAGRVPTAEELNAIADYLGRPGSASGVRPVTAHVVVVPGVLETLNLTVRLRPDTTTTRRAVIDAWSRFIATLGDEDDERNIGPIGALIEPSRISEAISAAGGEYGHDLISPSAPFRLERTAFPVAGAITFERAD
ncbi:baseplate J/gp47 family protein [Rhizobium sp. CFBP 8762]|uniref:baseplate J/gp47 family protein n=1 Tax=Rhizobium sp. CFBP 8762 TaxID=2775279 RepID=UPI0017821568|nr:baseplate J/gp47 family protein [Rhizobium sp. CFBP 8762]MBD8554929.1 baseplate J/gp47 family protein [Rhizobium sp. CFBP 8762]